MCLLPPRKQEQTCFSQTVAEYHKQRRQSANTFLCLCLWYNCLYFIRQSKSYGYTENQRAKKYVHFLMRETAKSHGKGHRNLEGEASKPFRASVFHVRYTVTQKRWINLVGQKLLLHWPLKAGPLCSHVCLCGKKKKIDPLATLVLNIPLVTKILFLKK